MISKEYSGYVLNDVDESTRTCNIGFDDVNLIKYNDNTKTMSQNVWLVRMDTDYSRFYLRKMINNYVYSISVGLSSFRLSIYNNHISEMFTNKIAPKFNYIKINIKEIDKYLHNIQITKDTNFESINQSILSMIKFKNKLKFSRKYQIIEKGFVNFVKKIMDGL